MPSAAAASGDADSKRKAARETIDILLEISTLLNTKLDRNSLYFCVSLIENGVSPEALANVIRDIRALNETSAAGAEDQAAPR